MKDAQVVLAGRAEVGAVGKFVVGGVARKAPWLLVVRAGVRAWRVGPTLVLIALIELS